VGEASFLTDDEKRDATGSEPLPASSLTTLLAKYSPDQPRVPAGNSDGGQWTSGGEGGSPVGDEEGDHELLPENAQPVQGHHYTPRELFEGYDLRPEVRRFFEDDVTGKLLGGRHTWTREHKVYNEAVIEKFEAFLAEKSVSSKELTLDQAKEFSDKLVKESNDPRIRDFNFKIFIREIAFQLLMRALRRKR